MKKIVTSCRHKGSKNIDQKSSLSSHAMTSLCTLPKMPRFVPINTLCDKPLSTKLAPTALQRAGLPSVDPYILQGY